jgi:hypothetical protein
LNVEQHEAGGHGGIVRASTARRTRALMLETSS